MSRLNYNSEEIAKSLGGAKRSGNGWLCLCPAHDDYDPSLSIKDNPKGGLPLVHCFAGCSQEEVIKALRARGLWPEDNRKLHLDLGQPPGISGKRYDKLLSKWWAYRDAKGKIIGYVARYDGASGEKEVIPFFKKDDKGGANWKAGAHDESRPLYNLHKIASSHDTPIMICEGEKAADAASKLLPGFVCTTSQGGCKAFSKTDWSPLKGREVWIWPDADNPGIKYAIGVARLVEKAGGLVKGIIDPEALGFQMGSGKDAADWPKDKPLPNPFPLLRVETSEEPRLELEDILEEDEPLILPRLPLETFPDPYQDFIRAVAESHNACLNIAISAFLSASAACIGRARKIHVTADWFEPCVLWLILVGPSGCGKSPTVNYMFSNIMKKEAIWAEEYRKDKWKYEEALELWRKSKNREISNRPIPPIKRCLIVEDSTIEAVTGALEGSPRGVLWHRDELSGMLQDFDRYVSKQGGTKARLCSAYNAGPWKVTRATKEGVFIPNAAVSIFGTIQPEVFSLCFSKMDVGSGFLPRFQMVFVEDYNPGGWPEAGVPGDLSVLWERTIDYLLSLELSLARKYDQSVIIEMGKDARELFRGWQAKISQLPLTEADWQHANSFISKLRGRTPRLALLLHILECFIEGISPDTTRVRLKTMERAIMLAEAFLWHQKRAFDLLSSRSAYLLTPLQARVVKAIVELEDKAQDGVIPTAMVAEQINKNSDHKVSSRSVGKTASGLGFRITRAQHDGKRHRCIAIDRDLLHRLFRLIPGSECSNASTKPNVLNVPNVQSQEISGTCERTFTKSETSQTSTAHDDSFPDGRLGHLENPKWPPVSVGNNKEMAVWDVWDIYKNKNSDFSHLPSNTSSEKICTQCRYYATWEGNHVVFEGCRKPGKARKFKTDERITSCNDFEPKIPLPGQYVENDEDEWVEGSVL